LKIFKENFVSPYFLLLFLFFENKFIHPDEIGCWQYACVCGVWAWRTKSNRGLGCAWWLDAWWAWNRLSSRRLLMGEESLVWWLHASGARWTRNCYVPIGYYWARSR